MANYQQCDILIIGAGIAGAGLAAHLPSHLKVTILETEDHPGYHSTGRTAAILIQNYGNPVIRQLTELSRSYFTSPDPKLFDHDLMGPRGRLFIETDPSKDDFDQLMAQAQGLEEISPDEALQHVPILKEQMIQRAAFEPGASDLDVAALHQAWLKCARQKGSQILVKTKVTDIRYHNHLWQLSTEQGGFCAPILVNAAGAWADDIARMAGIQPMGIIPHRRSMAVVPAPTLKNVEQWTSFCSVHNHWYAKPEHGHLFISPSEEDPIEAQDVWVDDMVLAEGLYRFEQDVDFPILRVERSWAGLRSFAPDRSPVVGYATDADGFFWLAGQGGYGIQTSPALSELAASILIKEQLVTKYSQPLIEALSPGRFS